MNKALIWLVLSVSLYWAQSTKPSRGASCIKVGGSAYVLGGQTLKERWDSAKYVYTTGLHKMYQLKTNAKGWITQKVIDYDKEGLYTTATALPEQSSFYYIRTSSLNLDTISLKSIDTSTIKSTTVIRSIKPEVNTASTIQDLPSGQLTLLSNDKNRNELILLGAKQNNDQPNNQVSNTDPGTDSGTTTSSNYKSDSITIFNLESNDHESYPVDFLTEKFYISAVYQGFVYVFGPGVDIAKLFIDQSSLNGIDSKSVLVKFNIKSKTWSYVLSTGDIPEFDLNYSHTQQKQQVLLVGKNEGTTGIIYILDLNFKIPKWVKVRENNFTGYESGCLIYYESDLYHYFGDGNNIPIQKINPALWDLEARYAQDKPNSPGINPNNPSNLLGIILGTLGGAFTLGLILALVYFIRRRKKKLGLPKIYEDFVICDPPMNLLNTKSIATGTTDSTQCDNTDLFEIDELSPDECFNRKMSTKPLTGMPKFKKTSHQKRKSLPES